MTGRTLLSGALFVALGIAAGAATWWLLNLAAPGAAKPAQPALPASVPKVFKEDEANVVTLTPEAVERLALKTAKVERKKMPRSRVYGGEVTVPAGQTILVAAPLGGTLSAPGGGVPKPGTLVKKGQPIFRLTPLLTPEGNVTLATAKIDAEGQVESAKAAYDGAKIALDRAKRLFDRDAGSKRAVDETQALHDVARKTLDAAEARRAMLRKVSTDAKKDTITPLMIEAPDDGLLRNVSAQAGQNVPPGAALFEVVDLTRIWLRVPVYVGDLPDLDVNGDATVSALTARPGQPSRTAKSTAAPPSANPLAGTVDLFYELSNTEFYSPGHRVAVSLPLKGAGDVLTVPWSAVLFDVYGGAWVYERTGERTFARRRVVVLHVSGETAVLKSGPAPGTTVVTAGPAELFGAETGFSR